MGVEWMASGIEVMLVFHLREFQELLQVSVQSHTCLDLRVSRAVLMP